MLQQVSWSNFDFRVNFCNDAFVLTGKGNRSCSNLLYRRFKVSHVAALTLSYHRFTKDTAKTRGSKCISVRARGM